MTELAKHRAACAHRMADHPDGLPCDRGWHPEDPAGHTYTGSTVDDRKHADTATQED